MLNNTHTHIYIFIYIFILIGPYSAEAMSRRQTDARARMELLLLEGATRVFSARPPERVRFGLAKLLSALTAL